MKKFMAMLLSMCMVLSISFSCFANEINTTSHVGYAYNLYTLEEMSNLDNISIDKTDDVLLLSFIYNQEIYDISFQKAANSNYESYFSHNGKSFYSVIRESNDLYTGLIRDITEIANPETLQFGVIISNSSSKLNTYSNNIKNASISGNLKNRVQHNKEIISGQRQDLNISNRAVQHVGVYGWNSTSFAEMWANLSMTGSYKSATITQYNIVTGAVGDGCYLRQYNNSGYNAYLWSSPVSPPRGVQYVNSTYHIPWNYMGALDVTVSSWYDIYGVPVPLPIIYADGYNF